MDNSIATSVKIEELAFDTLRLARNTLLVNMRFLDLAVSYLQPEVVDENNNLNMNSIAVDGEHMYFVPKWVLLRYKDERNAITRDYLHMIFHCVFHHFFVGTLVNEKLWDLACDIAVENVLNEMNLSCLKCERENRQAGVINRLKNSEKLLTAEKIYAYYQNKNLSEAQIDDLRACFKADDHSIWYVPPEVSKQEQPEDPDEKSKRSRNSESDTNRQKGDNQQNGTNQQNGAGSDSENRRQQQQQQGSGSSRQNPRNNITKSSSVPYAQLSEKWKDIAQRMQTDLETFSKNQGSEAGNLTQNLRAVTREKYDYAGFLSRFAVLGEAMKINDDEFDYIFYTYGMKLFEKMPLIEPLEYKDVKKIKEFVIAIDVSGSVSGELVQKFIQKTYNILKSQESFFRKINLHIIQCDTEIQEDCKITNQDEFDHYIKTMQLHGFGGTDFRPVFSYVDQLRKNHEFINLKGLIYFTDGYGTFPEHQPDYDTAFVFVDDEYNNPDVPVWAIKLVLPSGDI